MVFVLIFFNIYSQNSADINGILSEFIGFLVGNRNRIPMSSAKFRLQKLKNTRKMLTSSRFFSICALIILQMTVEFFKNFSRILVGKYSLLDPVLAFEDPQIARNETKTLFQTQHVSTFPGQKWLRTFEFFRTFYEKVWTLC